jgi:hypothetical protein
MAMEDLMKALMQSASGASQAPQQQQSGGGEMLSQVLGGLMGGGQQSGGQQSGGGDMMSQVLGGLMGATQQAGSQQGGGNMMSQVIGGLLGGAQGSSQGGGAGDQMLGALEQIIGGTPGAGQPMNMNPAGGVNMASMGMNNPIMGLLQPVVNQLAAKANISPQIAMVVASIAVHYLLSSHPSTSTKAPMDLGNVIQQLSTGSISPDTLHNSGMVNDVMQATGLNKQQAVKSLDTTFGVLGAHVQGPIGRTTN